MAKELMQQNMPRTEAIRKLEEIERNQIFNKIWVKPPKTVGEYFKKHKTKCQRKFKNTLQ